MINTPAPKHPTPIVGAIEPPAAVQPSETAPKSASAIIPAASANMVPANQASRHRMTRNRTVQGSERKAVTMAEASVAPDLKGSDPAMARPAGNNTDKATLQPMEIRMTQTTKRMETMMLDPAHLGRESLEVYFKSTSLWMKGYEDIMRTAADLAQSCAERQTEHLKNAVASRTLNDWSEAQRKIVHSVLQDVTSGAMKISETCAKVVSEATLPMTDHTDKAIQKIVNALAA